MTTLSAPPSHTDVDQSRITDHAIYADGLVRLFNGSRAVDEVDLRIPPGEIYGFLGPNGAGKSTIVRMLCTLLAPTAGRALVAGYDVASQAGQVRLRIGVTCRTPLLTRSRPATSCSTCR
jgi:ABC-2 type transport system ATP-binding protein